MERIHNASDLAGFFLKLPHNAKVVFQGLAEPCYTLVLNDHATEDDIATIGGEPVIVVGINMNVDIQLDSED